MLIKNEEQLYQEIKQLSSTDFIIANNNIKDHILKNMGSFLPCIIADQNEYFKKRDYIIDDKMLPLIFEETDNFDLSNIIFNNLFNFKHIDSDNPNYLKVKEIFELGIDKKYIIETPSNTNPIKLEFELIKRDVTLNEFDTHEDEIVGAAFHILNLIESGVELSNIDLVCDGKIINYVNYIFPMFRIPVERSYKKSFKKYDIDNIVSSLNQDSFDELDSDIKKEINSAIVKFGTNKKFLSQYLRNKTAKEVNFDNTLKIKSISDINPFNHIVLVGLADFSFLTTFLDDGFLKDEIIEQFELPTSEQLKLNEINYLKSMIGFSENQYLSFCNNIDGEEVSYLDFLNEFNLNINKVNNFGVNNRYNPSFDKYKKKQFLEEFRQFKTKRSGLDYLKSVDIDESYDNQFNYVSNASQNMNVQLSATSINNFYKCEYRFYLQKIINLKNYSTHVHSLNGTYIHNNLEDYFLNGEFANREQNINEYKEGYLKVSSESKFELYLEKINTFLDDIAQLINEQHDVMGYEVLAVEKDYSKDNALQLSDGITLVGQIDKVLKKDDKIIVVDYKSGNSNIDFKLAKHGLELQNLIYFVLLKTEYKDIKFGGTYRQRVTPKLSYDQKEIDKLYKLNGYTNSDSVIINEIGVENLNGISFKKDGELIATALKRTFSDEAFDEIIDVTNDRINNVVDHIQKGSYKINPKTSIESCKYCDYADICYKKAKDYEVLS